EQVATMKTSWKERIQYGVVCKSLPNIGYVPIATLEDIAPTRNWDNFNHKDDYNLNGLPKPNVDLVMLEGRSAFTFHYVLKKPVRVKASIYSFAYGVNPSIVKDWLKQLGEIKGLGDKHNSSEGYGCFTVKAFNVVKDTEIAF
ncbi:unnamed protein product, partial [marine sediment metagenome]